MSLLKDGFSVQISEGEGENKKETSLKFKFIPISKFVDAFNKRKFVMDAFLQLAEKEAESAASKYYPAIVEILWICLDNRKEGSRQDDPEAFVFPNKDAFEIFLTRKVGTGGIAEIFGKLLDGSGLSPEGKGKKPVFRIVP